MDPLLLAIPLFASAGFVALVDRLDIQRTYADIYAQRHGHIPALTEWFFRPDPDPDVEYWRRRHRNAWVLSAMLGGLAVVLMLVRFGSSG